MTCSFINNIEFDIRKTLNSPRANQLPNGLGGFRELVQLLFRLILRKPIALLENPRKLVSFSRDDGQIVVCQLAPSFLDRAFELLPVARNLVPVHDKDPFLQTGVDA